jgi:hypothetical protein
VDVDFSCSSHLEKEGVSLEKEGVRMQASSDHFIDFLCVSEHLRREGINTSSVPYLRPTWS